MSRFGWLFIGIVRDILTVKQLHFCISHPYSKASVCLYLSQKELQSFLREQDRKNSSLIFIFFIETPPSSVSKSDLRAIYL